MPVDVAQLSKLASTPDSGGAPAGGNASMSSLQAMPASQPAAGAGPPGGGEEDKMEKVSELFKEMVEVAHSLMTVAPQTTPIIRDGLKKMYLGISDLFGMGDEAKLSLRKGASQVNAQGMQQMGNL